MKTSYTLRDTWDIFPRGQHPDTRTNKEFLRDLENKLFVKRVEKKARLGNRARAVICLTTNKQYLSIQEAADEMKVPLTRMFRHLKGYELYQSINGNKFQYL
jgi:nucleoid-associated protein YgaU